MLWVTVIVFIVLLLVLVLVHEWGHFAAARRAGCKVEEFAFGFPPRLFSVTRGGTKFSFNLLPLGGYVKIEGEDMEDKNPGPTSFAGKSPSWRIFILSAGVLMNVVLAGGLLTWQAVVGVPTLVQGNNAADLTNIESFIISVEEGSPAQAAGLIALDKITRVGSVSNPRVSDIQRITSEQAGQVISIEIERQGTAQMVTITPRQNPPEGEGALGIGLQETGLKKESWYLAFISGVQRTGQMLGVIVQQFWLLLTRLLAGGAVGETITGPVGIAVLTDQVTALGLSYLLEFGALISLNLALINILPLPALDGGRILFVLLEVLAGGRRLPVKFEQYAHITGFVALIALMIFITLKDVARFF